MSTESFYNTDNEEKFIRRVRGKIAAMNSTKSFNYEELCYLEKKIQEQEHKTTKPILAMLDALKAGRTSINEVIIALAIMADDYHDYGYSKR